MPLRMNSHIDPLVLDHLHFFGDHLNFVVPDIVITIENSNPIELHRVQYTLTFMTSEEALDLLTIHLLERIAIVLSVDATLEFDSALEFIILQIDLHQDHILDLCLHLEDLSEIYNQLPLKIMTTTMKPLQSQQTKLKSACIPLK